MSIVRSLKEFSKKITDEDWKNELPILYLFLLNTAIGLVIILIAALVLYLVYCFWYVIVIVFVLCVTGTVALRLLKKK